jgi:hypothetical protein
MSLLSKTVGLFWMRSDGSDGANGPAGSESESFLAVH